VSVDEFSRSCRCTCVGMGRSWTALAADPARRQHGAGGAKPVPLQAISPLTTPDLSSVVPLQGARRKLKVSHDEIGYGSDRHDRELPSVAQFGGVREHSAEPSEHVWKPIGEVGWVQPEVEEL
jgi:hypothetical protein